MQYLPFTPNEYNCDIITIQAPMEVIDKINIFSQMYQLEFPLRTAASRFLSGLRRSRSIIRLVNLQCRGLQKDKRNSMQKN